jgi:hypothetical protein
MVLVDGSQQKGIQTPDITNDAKYVRNIHAKQLHANWRRLAGHVLMGEDDTRCYIENEKCSDQHDNLCGILNHHLSSRHKCMSTKIVLQQMKRVRQIFRSCYKLCQNGRVDKKWYVYT